jgi:hypothetical protein
MADPAYTAARACVECGTEFERRSARRVRCLQCSPARDQSPEAKARNAARAKAYRVANGDQCRRASRESNLRKARAQGAIPRADRIALARAASPLHRDQTCEGCGIAFRPKKSDRLRFCSRECAFRNRRVDAKWREANCAAIQARRKRWPSCKVHFPECRTCSVIFCSRKPNRLNCDECTSRELEPKPCTECGAPFHTEHGGNKTCSCQCRRLRQKRLAKSTPGWKEEKRSRRVADKLRRRGAAVERVSLLQVLERDGWTCQICGTPTPRELRGSYEPNAPEVDHVIPIAKGGEHSYRNTQCACRRCNGQKADSLPQAA